MEAPDRQKVLYEKPELQIHGTVEDLTQNLAGTGADALNGSIAG
jgi:hypothetical protein